MGSPTLRAVDLRGVATRLPHTEADGARGTRHPVQLGGYASTPLDQAIERRLSLVGGTDMTADHSPPQRTLIGAMQRPSAEQHEVGMGALKRIFDLLQIDRSYHGPLWHYTTSAGARDILKSGMIWASDADYLNDPGELRVIARALAERARDRYHEQPTLTNAARLTIANIKVSQAIDTTYIVSFSSLKDDLSQWRAYADDGAGYAIQFDSSAFHFEGTPPTTYLSKCLYPSEEDLNKSVLAIMDGAQRYSDEVGDAEGSSGSDWAHQVFTQLGLWVSSPLIKSPSYRGEEEVRLVCSGQTRQFTGDDTMHCEDRQARLRDDMFVPYVKIDVSHTVKSIMIGPKSSGQSDPRYTYGLRAYLDSINRNDLPIELSKHAYR